MAGGSDGKTHCEKYLHIDLPQWSLGNDISKALNVWGQKTHELWGYQWVRLTCMEFVL